MRLYVRGWSDWPPLLRPSEWNWIDFHLARIGFEWSPYKESCEVFVGILGLHVEVTLSWRASAPAPGNTETKP